MDKYEYHVLRHNLDSTLEAAMNALGADGWELCGFAVIDHSIQCVAIFRREAKKGRK